MFKGVKLHKKGKIDIVENNSGIIVLRVDGDFTNETTPSFQIICNKVMARKHILAVILDFEKVDKIDTSAFACMIGFIKEHKERNFILGIVNLKTYEKELMSILKIETFVHIFSSIDEAKKIIFKRGEKK